MKIRKVISCLALCACQAALFISFAPAAGVENNTVYEMYVNDTQVGTIKFAAKGLSLYDSAMEELKEVYPDNATVSAQVHFKEVDSGISQITDERQVEHAIKAAADVSVEAYGIKINDTVLCYVSSGEDANKLLDTIKAPYMTAGDDYQITGFQDSVLEDASFKEDVTVVKELIPYDMLIDTEQAFKLLSQSDSQESGYIVAEGDTLWSIARANNLHVNDILNLNPDLDPEKMKPGDEIVISGEKKLLSVITKEKISYFEELPYDTETVNDMTLLKGKTKTVQEGKKGKKEITAYIIKENGLETGREIISEVVIAEPVNEVIAKGTKAEPAPTPKPTPAPTPEPTPAPTPVPESPSKDTPVTTDRGSARGSDIVDYAKKYLGKPYVYAAEGPNSFDCSGFTWFVYKHFGISVPRSSSAQGTAGKKISKSELAPGDLVLFTSPNSGGAVGHVGIYIGGGNFIHASSGSEMQVIISTLESGGYAARYKGARRVIE